MLLLISAFVLAGGAKRVPGLRRLALASRLVGLLSFALLGDFVVLSGVPGYNGLVEIGFVGLLFSWPVYLANVRHRS